MTWGCADSCWLDTVVIDPMTPEDVDAVLSIERVSFPSAWSRHSYLRELRNPVSHYVVARLGGEVIGYAGLWVVADEGHVSTLAVHPDHRRRGLGRRLLNYLVEAARRRGAQLVTLEVREQNLVAQALYRQLGFVPAGLLPRYYGDTGEDAILMRRELGREADDGAV